MAVIEYVLDYYALLESMIPERAGESTSIPDEIVSEPGIYVVINGNEAYVGVSKDVRKRFQQRQGACFELCIPRDALRGAQVYIGSVRYHNHGATAWEYEQRYNGNRTTIFLDGHPYDYEHMLIRAFPEMHPDTQMTNSRKTHSVRNRGRHPIEIKFVPFPDTESEENKSYRLKAGGKL
ncbi:MULTISPECIES: hypothetical protein [Burkholderia]|uniref:GIY-YIG domain-containing protein n=1 Tax=Burkholderia singularis TaxID=1503053 RepID=A0A238H6B3_9BURK|nr:MULTISPECIES: hypothetical protein [Burkholderia]AOK28805.1 hypothetical protein AQ611_04570 [Burkholderia sp. Bp7605]SMG00866.1 hypothetical protein BSIN_3846 [Burkholderia singularis]